MLHTQHSKSDQLGTSTSALKDGQVPRVGINSLGNSAFRHGRLNGIGWRKQRFFSSEKGLFFFRYMEEESIFLDRMGGGHSSRRYRSYQTAELSGSSLVENPSEQRAFRPALSGTTEAGFLSKILSILSPIVQISKRASYV
jgi:hypothetical protein